MKKLTICGNIGRDAEVRLDQAGNPYAVFSVAVAVGTKANPKTDWVEVSCNGKLADVASNYVRKGGKILVDGFPTVNAYINNENLPVGSLRVFAHTLELLSRTDAGATTSGTSAEVHDLPEISHSNVSGAEEIAL